VTLSLVVCTFRRPGPVRRLLESMAAQTRRPDEVLVVDASPDGETEAVVRAFPGIVYSRVPPEERGLTRQRNWGIARALGERIAFLDDDTVPEPAYFEEVLACFNRHPEAVGVGGYIANEVTWTRAAGGPAPLSVFRVGAWERREDYRWRLRRLLGLDSPERPGRMPAMGHARSVGFFPPDGDDHPVELFMGGAATWRRDLLEKVRFSPWFEGYGLYEDLDFCLRASREGSLWLCTRARLAHLHEAAGRPDHFRYGEMTVRNGWRVWRLRWPSPSWPDRGRWWATTLLLVGCRLADAVRGPGRSAAAAEALGRLWGSATLLWNAPREDA
jgi:GT2 family glycosyltransferase